MRFSLRKFFKNLRKSFKIKVPDNLNTKKSRLAFYTFKHLYIFELGKGNVLGRVTSFLPELGAAVVIFRFIFNIEPTQTQAIWAFVFIILFSNTTLSYFPLS